MAKAVSEKTVQTIKIKENRKNYIKNNFILYLFLVPAVVLVFIFNYIPMYGVTIAFKDFSPIKGIMGSEWIGFDHFINFLQSPTFSKYL